MDADTPSTTLSSLSPLQARKRAAILDGARAVFLRYGFTEGSVDGVAAAADVGKQTVYRHFGSKEALVTALVETMCGEMTGKTQEDGSFGGAA